MPATRGSQGGPSGAWGRITRLRADGASAGSAAKRRWAANSSNSILMPIGSGTAPVSAPGVLPSQSTGRIRFIISSADSSALIVPMFHLFLDDTKNQPRGKILPPPQRDTIWACIGASTASSRPCAPNGVSASAMPSCRSSTTALKSRSVMPRPA